MGIKGKLVEIIGEDRVIDNPAKLGKYSKDNSFTLPIKPDYIVKPKTTEEIQALIIWANETKTPVIPISSGEPHFHGDTVPGTTGTVILDLSDMKKIISIDPRNRICRIEPGVTYKEIQTELIKHNLSIPMSLLPRANKSVVTSFLEREPRIVPKYQWTMLDPLRSMEVIWGNGQKMNTGGGLATEQVNGPGQVDYFRLVSAAQGSMGIITKASIKCEVLPDSRKFFLVPSQNLDDLINFLYKILRIRFADELFLLNSANLAAITSNTMVLENCPPWIVIIGIAGRSILTKEKVDFLEQDIREIAQQCGLQLLNAIDGVSAPEIMNIILNCTNEPYWKTAVRGAGKDIFFLTTLDKTPEFIKTMNQVAEEERYPLSDIGVYIQPVHQGVSCHCEFNLPYNPDSQLDIERLRRLFYRASELLLQHGAFYSRPYEIWADMAYGRDVKAAILLKKVKHIFDPGNIMNPGKLCF